MNIHNYIDQPISQRQQTVNLRTYQRNIPSHNLQPYLDSRPVMTKHTLLPIIDNRTTGETTLQLQPTYSPEHMFYPGNDLAPWSGYASNINHESELRNQLFALQKSTQSVYIPSSNSDLYQYKWTNTHKQTQPFTRLFTHESFYPHNPNPKPNKIGYALFNNSTRHQNKELTNDTRR